MIGGKISSFFQMQSISKAINNNNYYHIINKGEKSKYKLQMNEYLMIFVSVLYLYINIKILLKIIF
jgi:hypothetical protein